MSEDKKRPTTFKEVLEDFAKQVVQIVSDSEGCKPDAVIEAVSDFMDGYVNSDPFVMYYCNDCEHKDSNGDREPSAADEARHYGEDRG